MKKRIALGEPGPTALGRLLSIPATIAFVMLAATSAGLYGVAAQSAREESSNTVRLGAEATAQDVSRLMGLTGGILDQLAQDPELAQILDSGDPARILGAEERLSRIVPGAVLVRLVPDTIGAPDEQRSPRMGFADLEAVRQTKTGQPLPPALHAANTPDAHIAMARKLSQGNGVVLASLAPKFIASGLPAQLGQGALELKQNALSLAFQGDAALKGGAPDGKIPVKSTSWAVSYWSPLSAGGTNGLWFLAFPLLAAIPVGAAGYFTYRRSIESLHHDQDNIARIVQDLLSGKRPHTYPVHFKEMQRLMAHLEQIKPMPFKSSPEPRPATLDKPSAAAPAHAVDNAAFGANPSGSPPSSAPGAVPAAIFRDYDIRGVVGETLTPGVVQQLGRAIGSEARERGEFTVAIARDGRVSSPELSQALGRGLMDSGCSVIDLGRVPTPVLYFATHVLNTESGVMITGSHDPARYNGLKIVIAGESLAEGDIRKLRTRIERNDFTSGQGQLESRDIVSDYMERIVHDTQLGRSLKIVVDCGNGVAGAIAPALLGEIGCEVMPLFCEVDGHFPNHPADPSQPENLAMLIHAVQQEQADLGIALDGDGDRIGVVDSSGKIIWPDRQMMLFAADVLSREPGSDIVFDVKCTRHLASHIVKHGGRPLMWKTGHAPIKAKLRETGALLGGEMRGHIFFKERWYGFDDAIYACARLVEILSGDPRSSAEVFAELPDSVSTPDLTIALEKKGDDIRFIEKLREVADFPNARVTDIDGLRVDFADGWGLVNASAAAPALVLHFEADNTEALARIQSEFKTLLKKVQPDISFPLTLCPT
jgi:phosphomannomutase/phosphoglucomutase